MYKFLKENYRLKKEKISKLGHVQNPPAIKIHPVKLENRLPIEVKG